MILQNVFFRYLLIFDCGYRLLVMDFEVRFWKSERDFRNQKKVYDTSSIFDYDFENWSLIFKIKNQKKPEEQVKFSEFVKKKIKTHISIFFWFWFRKSDINFRNQSVISKTRPWFPKSKKSKITQLPPVKSAQNEVKSVPKWDTTTTKIAICAPAASKRLGYGYL